MGSRYQPGSELILKEGVTTSDGSALGTTLIDASLIGKPNYPTALQVRLLSGTYQLITRTAKSFDSTTGTITFPSSTPFPGQIVTGTGYVIMGVSATSADVLDALEILSPVNSTTTNDGAGGLTVIDTTRTEGLDYWKSQTLMITSGACDGQVREITGYNNATQTYTVSPAFFSNIVAGVTYRVLSQLPADIDITALQADVGDASASTLGSLYAILGNPAQSFLTMVGYEGAASLAAKLTAARAGYIDILNSDDKFLLSNAITGEVAFSLYDILKVSATEKLKNFVAKTGGTEIGVAKSQVDALGHTGLARLDSGLDGVLADGLINGAGTVLPANKSLYDEVLLRQGLVYYGDVTTYTDTTHFKSTDLIGFGNDFFKDYYVYVVRDAGGAGAAPQGESQQVSAYTSADGTITHTAFTTPLAVTDIVLLIHRDVAELKDILDLTRTYGSVAVSAEVSLFIDDAPVRATVGRSVKVDLTNMAAGDTYILREYYRLVSMGSYVKFSNDAANTFVGAQDPTWIIINLDSYLYGCKITAQKIAGTDRTFNYESFVEA